LEQFDVIYVLWFKGDTHTVWYYRHIAGLSYP